MCAFLDVDISLKDQHNGSEFRHSAEIYDKNGSALLEELGIRKLMTQSQLNNIKDNLRPTMLPGGDAFGIAAIDIDNLHKNINPHTDLCPLEELRQ